MTITALPVAPNRATDSASSFSTKADALLSALPTMVTQINADNATVTAAVAASAADASGSAATASGYVATVAASAVVAAQSVTDAAAHASIAAASANMKGNWPALTGALNKPASVVNSGKTWALLNNLADVTTSKPGSTADWQDITPAQSAYAATTTSKLLTLPVGTSTSQLRNRVTVDANIELLIFQSTAAISAVCYDNSTKLYGAPVLVRSTAAKANPSAVLVGIGKVLIASCPEGATTFESVVLSLTGTAIAVATAVPTTLPESAAYPSGLNKTPVTVGSSYVFALKLASSNRLIAVTVAGTTPTNGATLSLDGYSALPSIRPIDSTRFLAVYSAYGTGLTAKPITVSAGTTLTEGTGAALGAGSGWRYLTSLTTGRWAIVYTDTNCMGGIISVSGTTATATTVTLNAAADINQGAVVKVGDQLVVQCSTTIVNVLTDIAGTATAGAAVTTQVLATNTACIGYGTDYAAFGGANVYSVVTLSGNNPVLSDSTSASGGMAAPPTMNNGNYPDDGPPISILTLNGKSAQVLGGTFPSVRLFAASAASVQISLSAAAYPYGDSQCFQSPSVLWTASQNQAGAGIRINRVEMT